MSIIGPKVCADNGNDLHRPYSSADRVIGYDSAPFLYVRESYTVMVQIHQARHCLARCTVLVFSA